MGKPVKFTDRKKPWVKRSLKRKVNLRLERERILIVCEGSKTEPNYFQSIQSALPPQVADIVIQGEGANTQSLVDRAKQSRDLKKNTDYSYDEVWVVFDRDSFKPSMFDNAIHSAEAAGMKVAWSNEAFELWYILHFEDRQTGMNREEYKKCLTNHLGCSYQKNDPDMYSKLVGKGDELKAMQRAKNLQNSHVNIPSHAANPCTKVNELVGKLNAFKPHSKPSLLFITGWAHGADAVQPMAERLAGDFEVQIRTGAQVLCDGVLPSVDYIVTGSMGGILAMELLPEQCKKLVLISSTAKFCAGEGYVCGTPEKVLRRMILQLKRNPDAVLEAFFENVHFPHQARSFVADRTRLVEGLEYLLTSDVREKVPTLDLPVLLLHGAEDQIIPSAASEWLHAHLPNSQLKIFPKAGHALPAHQFEAVMCEVSQHLEFDFA